LIGGAVVDSAFGAGAIPFAAAVLPVLALLFILSQEQRGKARRSNPALPAMVTSACASR
jgi:DHA1 family inner membrane transport protein